MSERSLFRRQITDIGVRVVSDADRVLEFVIQSENQARDGHVIRTAGVRTADYQQNPVVPWCHVYRPMDGYSGLPVGRALAVRKFVDEGKTRMRVKFAGDAQRNDFAESVYLMLRDQFLNMSSFGWETLQAIALRSGIRLPSGMTTVARPGALEITESNMLEGSIVLIGSDKNALAERARRSLSAPLAEQFVAEIERGEAAFESAMANAMRLADAPAEVRHLASSQFTTPAIEDRGWGEWPSDAPIEVRSEVPSDPAATEARAMSVEDTLLDVVQRMTRIEESFYALESRVFSELAKVSDAPEPPEAPEPQIVLVEMVGQMSAKIDQVRDDLRTEITAAFGDLVEVIHNAQPAQPSREATATPARVVEEPQPPASTSTPAPTESPEARLARIFDRELDRRAGVVRLRA